MPAISVERLLKLPGEPSTALTLVLADRARRPCAPLDQVRRLPERAAALEARLARQPPKTPANSSLPPARGAKADRPPRPKTPRRQRAGPGVTRDLAPAPDHTVDRHARACAHCGAAVAADGQTLRHAYDHLDLAPLRPAVTRGRLFGRRRPACRRRVRGAPPAAAPAGSPFGPSIVALLAYLCATTTRSATTGCRG